MKWEGERKSSNVEDRRGGAKGKVLVGGGLGTVAILVVSMLLGVDPEPLLDARENLSPQSSAPSTGEPAERPAEENRRADFTKVVLATTEDVWNQEFKKMGKTYQEPGLVLFTDRVDSACGNATAAVGPFYCPGDKKAYIDLSFYEDLERQLGAPGDFAQAYVIAHEVGHHVQNLLGASTLVHRKQRSPSARSRETSGAWRLSFRLIVTPACGLTTLTRPSNCLSRVTSKRRSSRPPRSAMTPCRSVRVAQCALRPLHTALPGERVKWFKAGIATGDPASCDTFSAMGLN